MMKASHVKFISVIIAAVFLIAILQLVGGVISDNSNAPQKGEECFNALMVRISNAAAKHEPGSPEFSSEFVDIVSASPDIVDIQLDINGVLYYDYPNSQSTDNPERIMKYTGNTRTAQGRTLSVNVLLYAAKPFSIYYRARISFLLILAGTIAAVILIMYLRLENSEQDEAEITFVDETTDKEPTEKFEQTEEVTEAEEVSEVAEVTEEDAESADEAEVQEAAENDATKENSESMNFIPEEAVVSETETIAESVTDEAEPVESVAEESAEPLLEDLLAEALQAASEQSVDISVFVVRALHADDDYNSIKERLSEKIGTNGSIASHNGTLAAILENTSLDAALQIAEALQHENSEINYAIGIASRSGRTITARRLITEAEQAAAHADKSAPVIAFRVDPEKYRKFLEEQA